MRQQRQQKNDECDAGDAARPMGRVGIGTLVPDNHLTESIPEAEKDLAFLRPWLG